MAGSLSKELGPGVWWSLHSLASDPTKFQELRTFVNQIATKFPCKDCRDHFQQLLKQYPLERVNPLGVEKASPLGWSWTIHNVVNVSIGKPLFSWEECKQNYWGTGQECDSCSRDDGANGSAVKVGGFGPLAQLPRLPPTPTPFRR
jgi:hypothetical protein